MRVSDDEREETIASLRAHMLAGRITAEELDERVGEVWAARYDADLDHALRDLPDLHPPAAPSLPPVFVLEQRKDPTAQAALVTGVLALVVLVFSGTLLSILTLPASITAWVLARGVLREDPQNSSARAGLALGIIGTVVACLALTACAAIVT